MKRWMMEHDGQRVLTEQTDKRTEQVWSPGDRKINAERSTYVTLDGSRRDYAGMRVVSSDADSLTVEDDWHRITYTITN